MNPIQPKLPINPQITQGNQNTKEPDAGGNKASFKEVWADIQTKMGAKPKKVRQPKKKLDKDDFLRIMVMQMKHQDPTKPFDVDKMATELAQMTSVEQLKNMNSKLDKLISHDRPSERLAMTSLIGKTVSVNQNKFIHQKGEARSLSYHLPEAANDVKVVLINEKGEPTYEKSLGRQAQGSNNFIWDGKKTGGALEAETGNYLLQIQAFNQEGRQIPLDVSSKGQIIGVSFEGQEPVFLVGDHVNQTKVPMSSITLIEGSTQQPQQTSGNAAPGLQNPKKTSNFFTFEKGKGSKPLDMASLDSAQRAALSKFSSAKPEQKSAQPSKEVSKGFPSGLGNSEIDRKEVK